MTVDFTKGAPESHKDLALVLQKAFEQSANGKGKERHGAVRPFKEQRILSISRDLNSLDGLAYQVCKKAQEACGLPTQEARLRELYGAIVYAAAMCILVEEGVPLQLIAKPE